LGGKGLAVQGGKGIPNEGFVFRRAAGKFADRPMRSRFFIALYRFSIGKCGYSTV
jgi:hypothetical protein